MSESLFELSYTRSAEQVKEAQRHLFLKRSSAIAMHVLLIVCFVLNLGIWIWLKDPVSLIAAICVLLIAGLRLWFYRWTMQTVERREEEMFHGDAPEITVRIYDDRIESEGGGKTNTQLSSLRRVYRTGQLIIPLTRGNLIILLPTDAFTKGTPAGCLRFFASKGIRVQK